MLAFPRKKHENSQKGAKFMNFSFWPFLCFGLPGRLLNGPEGNEALHTSSPTIARLARLFHAMPPQKCDRLQRHLFSAIPPLQDLSLACDRTSLRKELGCSSLRSYCPLCWCKCLHFGGGVSWRSRYTRHRYALGKLVT